MNPEPSRRGVILGGCAILALLTTPRAEAASGSPAPRATCPHVHCRHHRPLGETEGLCALSLNGEVIQ